MKPQPVNLLYVEDDPDDRDLFTRHVEDLGDDAVAGSGGIYLETVPNVDSAIFSMRVRVFDILFVDFLLWNSAQPGDSGGLLRRLLREHLKIPLVLTTGLPERGLSEDVREMIDAGSLRLLPKQDWSRERIASLIGELVHRPLEVLCLEDDDDDARFLEEALAQSNTHRFNVHRVRSLAEARNLARQQPIDIYLVDLLLKAEDGLEFALEIAQQPDEPTVLVITGMDPREASTRLLRETSIERIGLIRKDRWDARTILRSILSQRNCPRDHTIPGVYLLSTA